MRPSETYSKLQSTQRALKSFFRQKVRCVVSIVNPKANSIPRYIFNVSEIKAALDFSCFHEKRG